MDEETKKRRAPKIPDHIKFCTFVLSLLFLITYILMSIVEDSHRKYREAGYEEGELDGYEVGYNDGYDVGYYNGKGDYYSEGYNEGYEVGYEEGYDDGYNYGYDDGTNR